MYYYNIFQISQNPIPDEMKITEDDFYMSSFVGDVASKLETLDPYEQIRQIGLLGQWLEENNLGKIEDNVLILQPELLKQPYYSQRYVEFKAAIEKLKAVDKQKFLEDLDGVRNAIFEVEGSLIKQQDHYVFWDSDNAIPLDEFLRTATPDKPYYIGGVCRFKYF